MTSANVFHFGAGIGFFEDRNDLGFGKSASFHHGLLVVILPESSSYYMSTFEGKLTGLTNATWLIRNYELYINGQFEPLMHYADSYDSFEIFLRASFAGKLTKDSPTVNSS